MKIKNKIAKNVQKTVKNVIFTLTIAMLVCCLFRTYAAQADDEAKINTIRIVLIDTTTVALKAVPNLTEEFLDSANINKESIKSVDIPTSVISIGTKCFEGCKLLESVILGKKSKLKSIDASAFSQCINLATIDIPASVISIGTKCFEGCRLLGSVILEKESKLESIEASAFSQCINLATFVLKDAAQLKTIGNSAFADCSRLTNVVIPSNVQAMGDSVFNGCSHLESVSFEPNNAIEILCSHTFTHCGALTSVVLPQHLKTIGDSAFKYCGSLESVAIPTTVEIIKGSAFDHCQKLASIELPPGLKQIGYHAFMGTALKSVVIPASVQNFGEGIFDLSLELERVQFASYANGADNYRHFFSFTRGGRRIGCLVTFGDSDLIFRFTRATGWLQVETDEIRLPRQTPDNQTVPVLQPQTTTWFSRRNIWVAGVVAAILGLATFAIWKKGGTRVLRLVK
jgi:hypothetical protein